MGSNYTGFSWNFNDPSSGSANTSSINNATHNFSAPGNYTVLLLLNTPCSTDTLKQVIGVNTPSLNVTGNVTLCPFQSCTLNVSGANSYTWSNGLQSNSVVLNPSVTTQYTISGTSSVTSCISTKTLTLIVNKCLQLTQEAEEPDVFTVFPNPANESVQVNSTVNLPITYVLLNQMGDIIWQGSKQSATFLLDLKNLQAGMYVLYLNNNKTTARVKLLKL
jgi:PKD repeat protein